MSLSKQEASLKEKGSARRKLQLATEPDDDEDTAENDLDVELPPPPSLPVTDYKLGRIQLVQSDVIATATKKQPNKAGNNREATSSFNPPVLKPTCSKMFKQSGNHEEAGSVAAYLAMRERQKQNLAAPTMENVPELGQEGMETEEVEIVQAPRKPRGRSKMSAVHAIGPNEKVINVNEEDQPISDEQKTMTELSNFLGTLSKDNVSLTYINWHVVPVQLKNQMLEYTLARYVIPEEGHKWVMHTLNESWRRYKSMMKKAHYRKYSTDEEMIENKPNTISLEDFKMLLKYWGDESVQKKKDLNIAKPSDAEIYLETYKQELGRTYKTDTEELRTKYRQVQELVNAGNIVEANALVHGDQYVQKLSVKIKQDLESDLEAKVNAKVASIPDNNQNWRNSFVGLRWENGDWGTLFRSSFRKVNDGSLKSIHLTPEETIIYDELTRDDGATVSWTLLEEFSLINEINEDNVPLIEETARMKKACLAGLDTRGKAMELLGHMS
ncbi:hypothetical protein AgCh_012299 [Apium graveolens]